MTGPAEKFRPLASRLLKREAGGRQTSPELEAAAGRICRKLFGELGPLVGAEGLNAIIRRAIHLAKAEFSFLQGTVVEYQSEGCLRGLHESAQGLEPGEVRAGIVALIANIVRLLTTFIGEAFTLRLLDRAWPDVLLEDEADDP